MCNLSVPRRACVLFVFCAAMAIGTPAQTFERLHSFDGTDGQYPNALVQGTNGNLYGTTQIGGASGTSCGGSGCGGVFSITAGGRLTTLYNFCSQANCTDGGEPAAALIQGTDGKFYGTTYLGGANNSCGYESAQGCGTVFSITAAGTLTTLYSFCAQTNCADGEGPVGALVQGNDGNFYGATSAGGNLSCGTPYNGCGTVFKITPGGTLTTLYSFCAQPNCTDGAVPEAALIQGNDGNLYGTTNIGGSNSNGGRLCSPNGCGTVFKITPDGMLTTLYAFCQQVSKKGVCTDGDNPIAALVQGVNGTFYGTTEIGGTNADYCQGDGCGTVFNITTGGTLTTLHRFCTQTRCPDGAIPEAALIQGTDGNFYGTTYIGGAKCMNQKCGTVFSITPGGAVTTLHSFDRPNGAYPAAALVPDTNGTFYGTTQQGGANGDGTVFSLSVGLGPFVEMNPASGNVGAAVNILGTGLKGATSVTFNGTAATFTVKSKSEITATVPTGATTGTVQVVTPGGTLSSNVPFRVLP